MPSLPDSIIITNQLRENVYGKTIKEIKTNKVKENEGKFNLDYTVNFDDINKVIEQKIIEANANWLILHNDLAIYMNYDNGGLRYYDNIKELTDKKKIKKHKTATFVIDIIFNDNSLIELIINNWSGMFKLKHKEEIISSINKLNPYDKSKFDYEEFSNHFKKNTALIPLLTTAKGIMDISRNTVHEVLYMTGIHPMSKASSLNDIEIKSLYNNFIKTIQDIVSANGTNGFIDVFGNKGTYEYNISSKKNNLPCDKCGNIISKGNSYGSSYYYCPNCQIRK